MALISFPSIINPSSLSFGLQGSAQSFVSEFTGSSQYVRLPAARWYGTANWNNLSGDDFENLKVFMAQLEGPFNTFAFGDISKDTSASELPATVVLENNAQVAAHSTSFTVARSSSESSSSITGTKIAFKKGDYFHVISAAGQELKLITADTNLTGNSGTGTLSFAPALRGILAANSNLTRHAPRGIMRLASNDQTSWDIAPPVIGQFGFSFLESY